MPARGSGEPGPLPSPLFSHSGQPRPVSMRSHRSPARRDRARAGRPRRAAPQANGTLLQNRDPTRNTWARSN